MDKIQIKIDLYGILNSYVNKEESLVLTITRPATLSHLVETLYQALIQNKQWSQEKLQELQQLIKSCAFAKNDQIIDDTTLQLHSDDVIAVLPPVCGG